MQLAGSKEEALHVDVLVSEARQDGIGEHRELRCPRARRRANHEHARDALAVKRDRHRLLGDARPDRRAPHRERNRRLHGRKAVLAAARQNGVDRLEVAFASAPFQ
jgi:hypothetical protein